MKAILEFDLDNPEDRKEHMRCMKSSDMASFIWELKHNFWRKWKHDDSDFNLDNYKDALWDLLQDYNVNIDELTD
jgi:hypothetical protein